MVKKKLIDANAPNRRVLFVHVPKCGGSSVVETLRKTFGRGRIYRKSYTFGLDPGVSKIVSGLCDLDMQLFRSSLLTYQLELSKARFVYGHFALSQAIIDRYSIEWNIVTMLREPRNRLLSEYYYNRYKSNREHFGTELSLEDWLETADAKFAATSFLRYFCGRLDDMRYVMERCDDPDGLKDQISASLSNLEKFTVIGNIENTAEFERTVQEKLGRSISLPQKNRSPQKNYAKYEDQPLRIRKKIDEICAGDSYLYWKYIEARSAEDREANGRD